jgi:DNA-binding NtrC family response regulator
MSGFATVTAGSAEECCEILTAGGIDLVVTDLRMSGMSGVQLAEYVSTRYPSTNVIVVTAFADVDSVIASMRLGVLDYITKPVNVPNLLEKVRQLQAQTRGPADAVQVRRNLRLHELKRELIGKSPQIEFVRQVITQVADSRSTVLITGESGSGKELVARQLHARSSRSPREFVAINCGAIPESLLESELFGYRKGAFTGAHVEKEGLLIRANGGTLFLDEIGELPTQLQVKLLRVLQEREIYPLGSTRPVRFDARIIAATNQDLVQMCEAGQFRRDLYYRLNVVEIKVPSLRERPGDIAEIAGLLVARIGGETGCAGKILAPCALKAIENYGWPGNVRELANAIERAMVVSGPRSEILARDLPEQVSRLNGGVIAHLPVESMDLESAVKVFSRRHIEEALRLHEGDKKRAAAALGVGLSSLYRKLEELEIR